MMGFAYAFAATRPASLSAMKYAYALRASAIEVSVGRLGRRAKRKSDITTICKYSVLDRRLASAIVLICLTAFHSHSLGAGSSGGPGAWTKLVSEKSVSIRLVQPSLESFSCSLKARL